MTTSSSLVKTAHRTHMFITLCLVITLAVLRQQEFLNTRTAILLFLAIEVPLLLVFAVLTYLRFRPSTKDSSGLLQILEHIAEEEPLFRPLLFEFRGLWSISLLIRGKRHIPPGAQPFGYTSGSLSIPAAFVVVSLVEMAAVHVIVPIPWLKIVLLVLSIWGVVVLVGFFAVRITHPHYILGSTVYLRCNHSTVLCTPLRNILNAGAHSEHAHTYPQILDGTLVLTHFQSTNVRLRFREPVPAEAPVSRRQKVDDFHATEVLLHVDEPRSFLAALSAKIDT